MNWWLVLPIALPFLGAVLGLAAFGRDRLQRALAIAGAVGQLVAAIGLLRAVATDGIQVMQLGNWAAPFGITIVADHFSALSLLAGSIAGGAAIVYAAMTVDRRRTRIGYFSYAGILTAAVAGAFLTGDLFNLFVWFEVMLIASFVLLAVGRRPQQASGATTYVTLNLIASATFLMGAGLAYALVGTLNFADLSVRLAEVEQRQLVAALAILLLAAFGSKAAAYPLSAWLPASYHTPSPDVSALFAGLLTKVGVYAVARSVTLFFPEERIIHDVILVGAGLTMTIGVLGALAQYDMRRLLSFHIASQVGYMFMGVGLLTPLALAGTTFYMAQHMVTKTSLFLVAGVIEERRGTGDLKALGGLYRTHLPLAIVFVLAAIPRWHPAVLWLRREVRPRARGPRGGRVAHRRGVANRQPAHAALDGEDLERGVLEGSPVRRRGRRSPRGRAHARGRRAGVDVLPRRVDPRARCCPRECERDDGTRGRSALRVGDGRGRGAGGPITIC
jgi:multicomponent Na+:H+ antiporter subunit D